MSIRVLLVEDDPLVALVTEDIFNTLTGGARFTHATSLSHSMKYQHHAYDMVVCDLHMPECSVEEVIHNMTDHFSQSNLIFFSASNTETAVRTIGTKRALFISKGAEFSEISKWIKKEFPLMFSKLSGKRTASC